jgi:glutathione peroxidase
MALSTLKMYLRRSDRLDEASDLYTHTVGLLEGGELDLATFRGSPALIVNTASRCGFTPQLNGLQALHERYGADGLHVLGCPSGDFAGQELDDAEAIGDVCRRNFGVTFTVTEKLSVRADPHPLWADLARQPESGAPAWNFTKYLVGADGRLIARFPTRVKPEDHELTAAIETALSGHGPQGRFARS